MKKYRIIVAGPRTYDDYETVKENVYYVTRNMEFDEIEIVSGGCDDAKNGVLTYIRKDGTKVYGADGLGEKLAAEKGWAVKIFPANWIVYGMAAGPIRNKEMALYSTHSLCFWDRKSKGTKSMIKLSVKHELIGSVVEYE